MNILHLKYVVEVADAGSINKAAENLYVAQPNLSRSIKTLEADLGITIFDRSAKGMVLTPDGEEFVGYARKILKQIDNVEDMYRNGASVKHTFSLSAPRASYISQAFTKFSTEISDEPAELYYKETNSSRTIKNLLDSDFKLGIIRYAENYDKHFKTLLDEKNLTGELVAEFRYVLLVSKNSSLASLEEIHYSDLDDKIEIAHADPYVPSLSLAEVKKEELPDNISRRIFVFERSSQFEILSENPETFMWVSPIPEETLERFNLIQRVCPDNTRQYKDVLIRRKDYVLTELDKKFITRLCESKRNCIK